MKIDNWKSTAQQDVNMRATRGSNDGAEIFDIINGIIKWRH